MYFFFCLISGVSRNVSYGEMHILSNRIPANKVSKVKSSFDHFRDLQSSQQSNTRCFIQQLKILTFILVFFSHTFHSKGSTTTICRKCELNVKQYGKPTACEFCNIIAAFVGSKCQRFVQFKCTHEMQFPINWGHDSR